MEGNQSGNDKGVVFYQLKVLELLAKRHPLAREGLCDTQ
jgi:hypothetical protein